MNTISFNLRPVAPFRLDYTAWALRRSPANESDRWDGETYQRLIDVDGKTIAIAARQAGQTDAPVLDVTATGDFDRPVLKENASQALKKLLGTGIDLTGFYRSAAGDPDLDRLAGRFRGLNPPRFPTLFEAIVNAIACQQISLNVCISLLNRLACSYGTRMKNDNMELVAFPKPGALLPASPDSIRALGYSWNKARAITVLTRAISEGFEIERIGNMSDPDARTTLLEFRGVGRWTADYVLLRGLGRLNIFPGGDAGAQNRLKTWLNLPEKVDAAHAREITDRWAPYSGMVYFHLLLFHLAEKGYLDA